MRSYPYESLAAQVLGYVGQITAAELKARQQEGYQPQDVIGQAGVEAELRHATCAGTTAPRRLTVDARGRPTSAVDDRDAARSRATRCG